MASKKRIGFLWLNSLVAKVGAKVLLESNRTAQKRYMQTLDYRSWCQRLAVQLLDRLRIFLMIIFFTKSMPK